MKRILVCLLGVMLMMSFVVCVNAESGGETIRVGMSFATFEGQSWVQTREYLEMHAQKYNEEHGTNIELIISSADNDAAAMTTAINDFINSGVDVICANCVDNKAIWTSISAAKAAGIPFITWGRGIAEGAPDAPDAQYPVEAYKLANASADYAIKKMIADGTAAADIHAIEIVGKLNDQNAIYYSEGFNAAAKEYGINLVETVACEWDVEVLLGRISPVLQMHPEVNFIWIPADVMVNGVLPVLERLDRLYPIGEEGHIVLASTDGSKDFLEPMLEGYTDCVALQDIDGISKTVIEAIVALHRGETPPSSDIPAPIITPETYEEMKDAGKLWALN